jgi:hypothetical protein
MNAVIFFPALRSVDRCPRDEVQDRVLNIIVTSVFFSLFAISLGSEIHAHLFGEGSVELDC